MITSLRNSERYKKDLLKYKSYISKCKGAKQEKLKLLIETYDNFAKEIDDQHNSALGGVLRPIMARDARFELAKMREKLDKFVKNLDN